MNRTVYFTLLLLFLHMWQANPLWSQDRKVELEMDKQRIEEEISYTSKLISDTKQSKTLTVNELVILNNKIGRHEALIATLRRQMNQLDKQVKKSETEIAGLKNDLNQLREEYARMIFFAYKNRNSYNKLLFLFSAKDFNQAYQRLKYFQQYASYRQGQIQKIEETQQKIAAQLDKLSAERSEKQALFESERRAQISLNSERNKKDQAVRQLSQKESQLKQSLREKEREAQKLQRAIEQIITEEIRLARGRKDGSDTNKDRLIELTPEERIISDNFALNRAKLPWPVERGIIASAFGEQPHPVLKKVKIKNNGIDIATTRNSEARAVFEGVVVSTTRITNTNYAVIVRHGEYFTVYSNLDDVYVKRGDKVKIKELIGRIHTNAIESKTEIHFEVWKGKQILNPGHWLAK
jgi:murein hydrolase activator